VVDQLGTLGFIATDAAGGHWIVSCYHVLCRTDGSAFPDGEPVYQPLDGEPDALVARLSADRADPVVDCAAARVVDGVLTAAEIFGLGKPSIPGNPVAGMRVVKSGVATGITEGVIREVDGDRVTIAVPDGFPIQYELTHGGDSGALWMERDTRAPVALHTRGNDTGEELAFGVNILKIINTLGVFL
jgi:hypothetical protein